VSAETGMQLERGQSVQVKTIVGSGKRIACSLAVVRWVSGGKAGLEFIRMSQKDQARLRWHVGFIETRRAATSAWSEQVLLTGISGA
jgi:hypothetical protein